MKKSLFGNKISAYTQSEIHLEQHIWTTSIGRHSWSTNKIPRDACRSVLINHTRLITPSPFNKLPHTRLSRQGKYNQRYSSAIIRFDYTIRDTFVISSRSAPNFCRVSVAKCIYISIYTCEVELFNYFRLNHLTFIVLLCNCNLLDRNVTVQTCMLFQGSF